LNLRNLEKIIYQLNFKRNSNFLRNITLKSHEFLTDAPQSVIEIKGEIGRTPSKDIDEDRKSLHSDEDKYDEIKMESDEDLKLPNMDVIPEENTTEEEKKQASIEQSATKHETFDSFIVNNDYFGQEDEKMSDILDLTDINAIRLSEHTNILSKHGDHTHDANGTVDDIIANLEGTGKLRGSSKPTKVEDINSVMNSHDYVVIKNTGKGSVSGE